MSKELSLFQQIIYEAPGDENPPPDIGSGEPSPDIPEDPPDIDMSAGDDTGGGSVEDPPDIGMGDEEGYGDPGEEYGGENQEGEPELNVDEKISAIMNMNLYQRYLSLLNNIGNQLSVIKNNSDMLFTLSNESLDIISSLKKLDENIRLYLSNYYMDESYSKNLLFFNKCINLLKLLNDIFDKNIRKGIKEIE